MQDNPRKKIRVLAVEDCEDDHILTMRELQRGGYDAEAERVETRDGMQQALARTEWDLIISDYILPKFSGSAALALMKESGFDLPFIIVSGNIGEDLAVNAMKAGAHDYILKGNLARLVPAVERELREREVRRKRRLAEVALLESRINLAKAQSIAHIGSWSFDLRTERLLWSDELYRIFGLDPDRFDGDFEAIIPRIVHPDDWANLRRIYRQMVSTFKAQPLEFRILLPDGRERSVYAEAEMVLDDRNRPVSIVGTVQDITERKRAEEERMRLATAVEAAADAVVVTDAVRGMILYINSAFEKITGYTRSEAVGRDLHLLDSGQHDQTFYRSLRETLQTEGFWSGRLIQKRKDGSLYEEECTYSPVRNSEGRIINYISIKRDVTEKSRLEAIAQTVETMNNIGYIFSGVRHEIGNPISSIRMMLDTMRKKQDRLDPDRLAEYLGRLAAEVSKVEYLLATLKNFNMYEGVRPQRVDIADFLDSFFSMIKQDFEKKGVTVVRTVDPKAKILYADTRALQQVLLNIFANASDALQGRHDPRIELSVVKSPGMVRLIVRDNGPGIDPARLNELFKPFQTTKKHGTGLGLVISRKMLARMNGTIQITSELNTGTSVEIVLPARKTETAGSRRIKENPGGEAAALTVEQKTGK